VGLILGELAFGAFVIGLLLWRGQEKARLRTQLHGKLIERCASAEDLARFLETDSGRRLLDAVSPGRATNPAWALVATVQVGLVLAVLGLGVLYGVSLGKIGSDYTPGGIMVLALGAGLLLASEVSQRLCRRYGLLPPRTAKRPGPAE
jgi:hypothetical protein